MTDATPGPPPPPPPPLPPTASSNRNVMILLSYLWLLALIPLVVEKQDREVQWHAKHGIVLTVAEMIFWVAFQIVTFALGQFLGCLIAIFAPIVALAIVIFHIFAIVKGINGQRLTIPGISQYADRF